MMNADKRQKIILGLVVVAVIILIWQLYSLFGGGSSVPAPRLTASTSPIQTVANPTQVMMPAAPQQSPAGAAPLTESQQKYLALVNEYQLVKLQRMIAEDQAATAAARAATAASLEKIGQNASFDDASSISAASGGSGNYELIYTGQDNGEWTATLKKGGQFNDVTAGSTLPDGAKVLSVNGSSVLIQQDNLKKLVTFNGITPFDEKADKAASPPASPMPSSPAKPAAPKPVMAEKPKPAIISPTPAPAEKPKPVPVKPVLFVPAAAASTASTPITKTVPVTLPPKPPLPQMLKVTAASDNTNTAHFDIIKADKKSYTIQIVSSDKQKAVTEFINQNKLTGKAQVLKTGQQKYIAVIGEYPDRQTAQKAIHTLPVAVRDETPFVKKISDVQSKVMK